MVTSTMQRRQLLRARCALCTAPCLHALPAAFLADAARHIVICVIIPCQDYVIV
jgi:hypothetical protein